MKKSKNIISASIMLIFVLCFGVFALFGLRCLELNSIEKSLKLHDSSIVDHETAIQGVDESAFLPAPYNVFIVKKRIVGRNRVNNESLHIIIPEKVIEVNHSSLVDSKTLFMSIGYAFETPNTRAAFLTSQLLCWLLFNMLYVYN